MLFIALLFRGQASRGATLAIAGTLLGVFWIGTAFAHAVLLRELTQGKGIIIDTMVGTFLGDTGAYLGRQAVRTQAAGTFDLSTQDR